MNAKPWYKSATVWSIAVSFISHLAGWGGVPLDDTAVKALVEVLLPIIGMSVDSLAIWARARAEGPLTLTQSGSDRAQFMRSPLLVALIVAALVMALLPGCKTLDRHEASTSLVVKYATMKVIEKAGDAEAQGARAVRIRAIASDVEQYAAGESVTIAALEAAVRAKLPSGLSPADRLLADALVQTVGQELQARVGSGLLSAEQLVQVKKVLGWVIEAAEYSAPAVGT